MPGPTLYRCLLTLFSSSTLVFEDREEFKRNKAFIVLAAYLPTAVAKAQHRSETSTIIALNQLIKIQKYTILCTQQPAFLRPFSHLTPSYISPNHFLF